MQKWNLVKILVLTYLIILSGCSKEDKVISPIYEGNTTITFTPKMVLVPKGTFRLGYGTGQTSPSGPEHDVTLTNDYEIGQYEITNKEYCDMLNFALNNNYLTDDYKHNVTVKNAEGHQYELLKLNGNYENEKCQIMYKDGKFIVESGMENRPVVYVTWYGAAFYCNILSEFKGLTKLYDLSKPDWKCNFYGNQGYRLPTEAEWEYAGRYDDGRMFPWGNNLGDATYANYNNSIGHSTDVGIYPKGMSKLGIFDMAGNVSEWVQDYYGRYMSTPQINPVNDTSGVYRQRRGGGWLTYGNNFLYLFYHTDTNYPFVYYVDLGFRVVKVK